MIPERDQWHYRGRAGLGTVEVREAVGARSARGRATREVSAVISRGLVVAGAVVALVLGGCASADTGSEDGSSPTATASQAATALERAQAALLPYEQVTPVAPGDSSESTGHYTAEGDQVSAPWTQFMICTSVGKADEGPPSVVEPGAAAAAWTFGTAGAAQLDQYAIAYVDEAAAQAAVTRAQAQAAACDGAFTANPEFVGEPPTTTIGEVPDTVAGFRVTALFSYDSAPPQDAVSTVMRAGDTVHYMRFKELPAWESEPGESEENPDTMLDPAWTEAVIDAAAANLVG